MQALGQRWGHEVFLEVRADRVHVNVDESGTRVCFYACLQVMTMQEFFGRRVTNVVFMGQGEVSEDMGREGKACEGRVA